MRSENANGDCLNGAERRLGLVVHPKTGLGKIQRTRQRRPRQLPLDADTDQRTNGLLQCPAGELLGDKRQFRQQRQMIAAYQLGQDCILRGKILIE